MLPILTGNLRLITKEIAAHDTLKLQFALEDLHPLNGKDFTEDFTYTPGQFVSLGFSEKAWRAYSIASVPAESHLELLVRLVEGGIGSEALEAAQMNDKIPFKGPFGHFALSENPKAHLVFCATGTGIAPFRSMIKTEAALNSPRSMILLYGGKNADDLGYLKELNAWSDELQVELGLSRDPDLSLPAGVSFKAQNCRITHLLEKMDIEAEHEFYLCGNGAMVKSVQEILETKGVETERIFMERFN